MKDPPLSFVLGGYALLQKRGNMRIDFIPFIDILSVGAPWHDIIMRTSWRLDESHFCLLIRWLPFLG